MSPAIAAAFHFLQVGSGATTLAQLDQLFAATVQGFGFNGFGLVEVKPPGQPVRPRLLAGVRSEWDVYYGERRLHEIDPVVPRLLTAAAPFTWTDVEDRQQTPEQSRLFAEAREAGVGEGLIVPVHGPLGDSRLVKLTTPADVIDPTLRPTLHAVAFVYAVQGRTLLSGSDPVALAELNPLSRRESECLTLVAEGKSDWDIGRILGISANTVHTLLERAKRRLGVRTRLQAVLVAMRKRWLLDLSPD